MDYISLTSIALAIIGSLMSVLIKYFYIKKTKEQVRNTTNGKIFAEQIDSQVITAKRVLIIFSTLVIVFGIFSIVYYWDIFTRDINKIIFALWLFIVMVAGMFVQVLSSNYKNGKALFEVSSSQLFYPLLFSIVVFYPIWAIGNSSPQNIFSFYAAFLNGFFWETIVSSAKLPNKN